MAGTFDANDPTASGMVLTFDDEFDSSDVSNTGAASGAAWANHLWYDSPNPGAVSVQNGVLSLASGGELSSVNSQGQGFSQTYGYFEIDMKVPSGVGTWPAFWLMSLNHVLNPSAPAAEIDIIEGQGNQPDGYYTTLHYNTGGGGAAGADQVNPMPDFTGDVSSTALSDGYARFGVLWAPGSNQITYYFNGNPVATSTVYSTTNSSPMMVLIDNWLGDMGWGGNSPVAGESYGPLDVDYVRVYQFASQDPTAVAAQAVSPAAGQTDPTALANADGVMSNGQALEGSSSSPASTSSTPAAPAANKSANGAIVTGTNGEIVTALGNVFEINSSGQIVENNSVLSVTNSVAELAWVNGTLYQDATPDGQNLWFSLNEQTGAWTETSDPLTASGSSSGTTVLGTNGNILTEAGNTFSINGSGQIVENSEVLSVTNSVAELAWVNGTLYQDATPDGQNLWFSLNEQTGAWTETSDPLTASGSSSGTTVLGTNGNILSEAGNTFSINGSGQIVENSEVLSITNSVVELAYVNGTLYQDATPDGQNLWFSLNEQTGAWTETSDPLTATVNTASTTDATNGTDGTPTTATSESAAASSTPSTTLLDPTFTDGTHDIYAVSSMPTTPFEITSFNPATDILDLTQLVNAVAEPGIAPTVNLEAGPNGATEVLVDPTGGTHGTEVLQLDHILPSSIPAADIWH